MRYSQFKIRPTGKSTPPPEQELDEVNMSPGGLKTWAKKHASGMKSGFEAELIFKNALVDDDEEEEGDLEPNYDQDERADSIDEVIEFFSSEMTNRRRSQLRDEMHTNYREWYDGAVLEAFEDRAHGLVKEYMYDNADWGWPEKIDEYLQDTMGKTTEESDDIMAQGEENEDYVFARREVEDQFDEIVDRAVREGFDNDDYQAAYDEFSSNFGGRGEQDWLRSIGIRFMSDAPEVIQVDWPHRRRQGNNNVTADGRYDSGIAQRLATSLESALGVKTQVESGTRGATAKRNTPADVWVFEADGSLRANSDEDMPVEIVSPPMGLDQTLEIMPKFFAWAVSNGAYVNKSTGLHMSVSISEHAGDNLDFTKAALFLGDQYVLEKFGRAGSQWCVSALSRIKDIIDSAKPRTITVKPNNIVTKAFEQMRTGLNSLATKAFASSSGFGKYFTINPKDKYIEFRSAGGKDYLGDIPKLQSTMLRYARAVSIGMDPAAEKPEYAKKLFKLLGDVKTQVVKGTNGGRTRIEPVQDIHKDTIAVFSNWMAGEGELTSAALKKIVKQIQQTRDTEKRIQRHGDDMMWYQVEYRHNPNRNPDLQMEVQANSPDEAITLARAQWGANASDHRGYNNGDFVATPLIYRNPNSTAATGDATTTSWSVWNINDPSWMVTATGDTMHQAIINAIRTPENDIWTRGSTNPAEFRADSQRNAIANAMRNPTASTVPLSNWTVWAVGNPSSTVTATGYYEDDAITDALWNPANQEWAYGHAVSDFRAIRAPNTRSSGSSAATQNITNPLHIEPGQLTMPDRYQGRSSETGYWVAFGTDDYDTETIVAAHQSDEAMSRMRVWLRDHPSRAHLNYSMRPADMDSIGWGIQQGILDYSDNQTAARNLYAVRYPNANRTPGRGSSIPEVPIDIAQNFPPTGDTR